jgi:prevent-host-death family protein
VSTHTVGDFKANFSAILDEVRRGEVVTVCWGRAKEPVAVLVPPHLAPSRKARKLGPLAGKASFRLKAGFKISDRELLGL